MKGEGRDRYAIDSLIAGICKRPDMYTMGGQFLDVVNFLSGFFGGLAHSGTEAEEVMRFNGFCDWLHAKLDWPRSLAIWGEFRRRFSDDKAALAQLAAYWSEYNAETAR